MISVPDPVGSLSFDQVLDTSLQVIWTVPENINGHLVGEETERQKKVRRWCSVWALVSSVLLSFHPHPPTYHLYLVSSLFYLSKFLQLSSH